MNDRMCAVDQLQIGVVDASSEIISDFVVRRERYPGQLRFAACVWFAQEEGDLFPVSLMIINSTECRSPVVHRVEEPVLRAGYPASRIART
jgi:hypothetical protein